VTLTLNQANSSSQVSVSTATSLIKSKINAFVSAYNTLNTFFGIQSQYNPNTQSAGVLSGDSTLAAVRNGVHDVAIGSVSTGGLYSTLTDLGIEFQKDGTLTVNDATLSDALANHLSDVQTFLQGPTSKRFCLPVAEHGDFAYGSGQRYIAGDDDKYAELGKQSAELD